MGQAVRQAEVAEALDTGNVFECAFFVSLLGAGMELGGCFGQHNSIILVMKSWIRGLGFSTALLQDSVGGGNDER